VLRTRPILSIGRCQEHWSRLLFSAQEKTAFFSPAPATLAAQQRPLYKKYKVPSGCLASIALALLAFIIYLFYSFSYSPVEIKKNLSNVDWLPESASQISFIKRSGFGWVHIYKCKILENDFLKFASSNEWQITSATDVYVEFASELNAENEELKIISDAYVFENKKNNNGGIHVIYDKKNKILYYSNSHR